MFKKLKIAITAVAVALTVAATVFGGALSVPHVGAEEAGTNKYRIDSGAYTLKMDDSVTETVRYRHTESYLFNARDTKGNIRLRFKTVSVSTGLSGEDIYGLVRGKSEDTAYAYAELGKTYWYVFGSGNPGVGDVTIYKEGADTDVTYDVSEHAFTVVIGGENQSSKMTKYNGSTADGTKADSLGATKICWDATNTNKQIDVTLENFAITDKDGFDLGIEISPRANAFHDKLLETSFSAYAGKTVTFKSFGDSESGEPAIVDKNGAALGVAITKNGDEYSFVMPEEEVKIEERHAVSDGRFNGTYYEASGNSGYVFGETSYKFTGNAKTEISLITYDIGLVVVTEGDTTTEGIMFYGNLVIGETTYKKLLSYTVKFVADEKVLNTVTVDSGDYFLAAPEQNPTKDGYTFVGWKTGKGESYDFGNRVTESIILYADFKPNAEHKDPEGGCGGSFSVGTAGIALLAAGMLVFAAKVFYGKGKKDL